MQITVQNMHNGVKHPLTLRVVVTEDESDNCPLCLNVPPEWTVDAAADEAMNPDSSAIGGASACTPCLNALIRDGDVEVVSLDPSSF